MNASARGTLAALLFCTLVDVLFLSPALFTSDVRAPGDLIANTRAFAEDREVAAPANPMLSDWSQSICAWHRKVREAWREGRAPLWDELSGCGAPLAANLQSEAFSPYLPLNLLGDEQYPDLRQLALLVIAQWFTILLARRLGLGAAPAALAAVLFAFASPLQIWSVYPMAGAWAFAPAIALGLLALRERVTLLRVTLAGLPIGLAVLSGHVESGFLGAMGGGLFALLAPVAGRNGFGARGRFVLAVPAAGLFGLGIAAIVLLPFFDYLSESLIRDVRALQPAVPNSPLRLATLLDPAALELASGGRDPDFMERTFFAGRVGVALALLALFGLGVGRWRLVLALTVTAVFGLGLASSPPAVMELIDSVPPFSWTPLRRMNFLAALPIALLAAVALDRVLRAEARAGRRMLVAATLTVVALAAALFALAPDRLASLGEARRGISLESVLVLAGTLGLAAVATRLLASRPRVGRALALALVLAATGEGVLTWRDFVPTVEESLMRPEPSWARLVRDDPTGDRVLPTAGMLPPAGHVLAGVGSPLVYDAIRFARQFRLLAETRAFFGEAQRTTGCDPKVLDLLGVGWTLSPFPADTAPRLADERVVTPEAPFRITRPGSSDPAQEEAFRLDLVVFSPTPRSLPNGSVQVQLSDAQRSLRWKNGDPEEPVVIEGLGAMSSRLDAAVRTLFSHHPTLKNASFVSIRDVPATTTFTLEVSASPEAGAVRVAALGRDGLGRELEEVAARGGVRLTRREGALPRLAVAPKVRRVDDLEAAFATLRDPGFDPRRELIIEAAEDALDLTTLEAPESYRRVAFERPSPEEITFDVELGAPAVLWVGEAPSGGWSATIDGEETALHPAQILGQALVVPAGRHAVRMVYRPRAFTLGRLISGLCVVILLGALIRPVFRKRSAVALCLLMTLLVGCDGDASPRLEMEVLEKDGGLVVRIPGSPLERALLGGRPWRGQDPLQTIEPDLGVLPVVDERGTARDLILAEGVLPAGRDHFLPLSPEQLTALPDPFALQLVRMTRRTEDASSRPSQTWIVSRDDGGYRIQRLEEAMRPAALALIAGVTAALGLVAWFLLRRTWGPTAGRLVLGLLIVTAAAAITFRLLSAPPRYAVAHEAAAPPLWWPAEWSDSGGDPLDRYLGAPFAALRQGIATHRRDDELLTICIPRTDGEALRRALHLRRALGGTVRIRWSDEVLEPEPGLILLPPDLIPIDSPDEPVEELLKTELGAVFRREGR